MKLINVSRRQSDSQHESELYGNWVSSFRVTVVGKSKQHSNLLGCLVIQCRRDNVAVLKMAGETLKILILPILITWCINKSYIWYIILSDNAYCSFFSLIPSGSSFYSHFIQRRCVDFYQNYAFLSACLPACQPFKSNLWQTERCPLKIE